MNKYYTQEQIKKAFYRGVESAVNSNYPVDTEYFNFINSEISIDELPRFDEFKNKEQNNYLSKYEYIHLQVAIGLIQVGKDVSFAEGYADAIIRQMRYK